MLTKIDKLQRLPPLRGVRRHFLGKGNNLNQEEVLRDTSCSTNMASFLAAVTLERRGIRFKTFLGWLRNRNNDSTSESRSTSEPEGPPMMLSKVCERD